MKLARSSVVLLALAAIAGCRSEPRPPVPSPGTSSVPREGATGVTTSSGPANTDDAEIAKAAQSYLDLLVEISPEEATALGLHKRDAELDDRTIAGFDKAVDREAEMLKALEAKFKNAKPSPSGKTDLAVLEGALKVDIRTKRLQRPHQRQPDLYTSPLDAIFQMTARDYAPAAERAKNILARLEKIPALVATAKENLLNPPRVWTEVGIDRAGNAKSFLDEQRPFLEQALPADKARIDAVLKGAAAAYDDYKKFLTHDVLPRSNGRFAAGRELFEFLLANDYFLDENADQILAIGKTVLAETGAQMNELAKKIDPSSKSWFDVTQRLKGNHPTADGVLDAYKKEVKRARDLLIAKDAFELPPGEELDVVDTPVFLRSTMFAAYDQPPPFDPSKKGFFFVTPVDAKLDKKKQEEMLREHDFGDIAGTAAHEAYPGHHLQLSFARTNPSIVRRAFYTSIFGEGWGLYSEAVMAELGFYSDEQHLFQLEWTLVRAARIVIDVGLHVGDMTFDQAVKVLTDEAHLEKPLAVSEVKRYTLSPTQPLSYLVGRQMIFKMRDRYKEREGAKFSLKKFHTDVLSRGTVAPSLMAKEIFGATP